jgi:hypothetical protein
MSLSPSEVLVLPGLGGSRAPESAEAPVSLTRQQYEELLAWDEWEKHSCAERGGHWWRLRYDHEEDELDLFCAHCPASADDLYPDGRDMIEADLEVAGRQVTINGWRGTNPGFSFEVPVRAEVWEAKYDTPGEPVEYDAGILVSSI